MSEYTYTYPNESFSGCDMVATLLVPDINDNTKKNVYSIGELQTISYSIHMERKAVRAIGNINAKDYVLGPRTIAGSLVFTVFNKHFAKDIINDINKKLDSDYAFLADELPPFDIIMSFANEYGLKAKLVIYGVRLINEGQVMSINDIYTENTYQFVATDIEYLDNENKYTRNSLINPKRYLVSDDININISKLKKENKKSINNFNDSVYLSYKKINDASINNNGNVKLTLSPFKDYGVIEIISENYNMKINLENSNIDKNNIIVSLPQGRYTAIWYFEEIKSNYINFTIRYEQLIIKTNLPCPIIEFLTENYCDVLSNVSEHFFVLYTNLNTGETFKEKLIGKRARLEKLEVFTEYKVASCNEDETSVSNYMYFKTLKYGFDMYQDFMQFVIYNIKNMKYDIDTYYEIIMKTKDIYYDTYEIKKYKSIYETFIESLKYYNKLLETLDSKDFSNEVFYYAEIERLNKMISGTKELISISSTITNDKVYGYNKDFIVVNAPILEEKDFCTNNLLVENNVVAVDFYRILNNSLQYIKTIKKNNFIYYNENYYICNFNDKPNCDYCAYAVNENNFRSSKIIFHTLSEDEKAKALSKKYKNDEYINYTLSRTKINTNLSYLDDENDYDAKNRLLIELSKDNNLTIQEPIIKEIQDNYISIIINDYEILDNARLVLCELNESLIETVKYKYNISKEIIINVNESCLKYNNSYILYIEDEEENLLSKTVSFIFNKDKTDYNINSYYINSYIEDLKNLFKERGLYTINLETLLYIELSNYNNKKFNILNNILNSLIENNNLISEYVQVINTFFEYYYSKYNIQDISDCYKLSYNNKTKKISIELYNAYCLIYEITNNINKKVIKYNDTIVLDAGKIYVINFIKKDYSERSNFLLIDTINNNIYNNIKIEMEEE